MNASSVRIDLVQAAQGKIPFDMLLCDLQIVNVFNGLIEPGNIGILQGRIVTCKAKSDAPAMQVIDGQGRFAIPGLIDTHVHIDSTLLTPASLAELMVPHGTTVVCADPMEISNVAGLRGLEAFMHGREHLPYHVYLEVPSRVPTAPGLETTGGELRLAEVQQILAWPESVSLGEMDPSKVLGLREEYFAKVTAAHQMGKIGNGHTVGLNPEELIAYVCGGLTDDHECIDYEEAKLRIALGMSVLIREGSTERNLEALVKGLVAEKGDTRHWMMCTDDKHPNEILHEGHIDYMVNKAIGLGLPPIQAIQMATLNAAEHFRREHEVGSLTPGRWADILLVDSLQNITPYEVYFKGKLVARQGRMVVETSKVQYPDWMRSTVQITRGQQAADFLLPAEGAQSRVRVIEITGDQIVNESGEAVLPVKNGGVCTDPERDLLKLAVVERYGKNGNIGLTFVRGIGLKQGAISSTVSHDHHNLVIAGADETSMATCARATQEMQGGFVLALGNEVLAKLPLPLGGLLSEDPPMEVIRQLDLLNEAAQKLGCILPAPFMTLSFISLPTVPELGLTDHGLIDVHEHAIISPFLPAD